MKQKGRLIGVHLYPDKKDRYIFYNIFNKKAYLINGEDDYKKYMIFQSRLGLSVVVWFVVMSFLKQPIAGVIMGILVYVLMSVFFYVKFVPSLPIVKDFVRPSEPFVLRLVEPLSNLRVIVAAILCFLMAVLLFISIQISDFDEISTILNYVLIVAAGGGCIFFIIGYILKNKKK